MLVDVGVRVFFKTTALSHTLSFEPNHRNECQANIIYLLRRKKTFAPQKTSGWSKLNFLSICEELNCFLHRSFFFISHRDANFFATKHFFATKPFFSRRSLFFNKTFFYIKITNLKLASILTSVTLWMLFLASECHWIQA